MPLCPDYSRAESVVTEFRQAAGGWLTAPCCPFSFSWNRS